MQLKPSYDAMSDVPTGYENAYAEKDGKVDFTGGSFEFKTEAEYQEVHKAKQAGFTKFHELETKFKSFEGIDPKKHKELTEEIEVLRAKAKDGGADEETIKAIVEARVKRLTEELTSANGRLSEENTELLGFKQGTQKTTALDEVLGKHVSGDALADAEFIIGSAIERQADGSYMSNGKAGFEKGLSIEQLVSKAVEGRPHWQKKNTPGHGAKGSSGAGGLDKRTQLNEMLEKNKKNELSRAEQAQMVNLAADIKAEQQGD